MIAQLVKNPPAMQETLVQFLGREDLLETGQATHSSLLGFPWWVSWERICLQCRRPGKIDPCGWEDPPGEGKACALQYSGLENAMDCSPWGRKEEDGTEQLSLHFKHFSGCVGS